MVDASTQASRLNGLSSHSSWGAILPEPRPNLPIPLKLLLPALDLRDFLGFLEFPVATNLTMVLRQKGQRGAEGDEVAGLGLLWQHKARVQCAHIICPHSWTWMAHASSKQMPHSSVSLACDKPSASASASAAGSDLSLLASIRAHSNRALASPLRSLMNFRYDGHTRGSADEGFSRAAHASWCFLNATTYGIFLHPPPYFISYIKEELQIDFRGPLPVLLKGCNRRNVVID